MFQWPRGSALTLSLDGADLAGVSPALTGHPGAAARFLRCVCRFGSLAAAVLELGVAVVHSHILPLTKTKNSGVKLETLPDGFLVSGDYATAEHTRARGNSGNTDYENTLSIDLEIKVDALHSNLNVKNFLLSLGF